MTKRNINIEWIRVLSCIFVIIIHVSNFYHRHEADISQSSYLFSMIVNVISRMAVPFFFMISGALLLHRDPDFSYRRVWTAMKTLAFWTGVFALWIIFYRQNKIDWISILYEPIDKTFWFMYVMIGIYIALPFLQVLFQHMDEQMEKTFLVIWFAYMIISYISKFFKYTPAYEIPLLGSSTYYVGYFILGSYIYRHQDKWSRKYDLSIAGVCLIVILIWAMLMQKERVFQYKNFFMVIASSCSFHYLLGIKKVPLNEKWISMISSCSLGIYYIHTIFLDLFKNINYLPLHSIVGIPLVTSAIFALSFYCIYLSHKLRLARNLNKRV